MSPLLVTQRVPYIGLTASPAGGTGPAGCAGGARSCPGFPHPNLPSEATRASCSLAPWMCPKEQGSALWPWGAHRPDPAPTSLLGPLLGEGTTGLSSPPHQEPELFPTYCFISGPVDKYSSIPRGGREVPNNGPESWRPRCAVCAPPGLGGCQRPPTVGLGRGPLAEGSCTPFFLGDLD